MTPSDTKAILSFSDGSPSMDLPLYKGTIGPDVIDIRKHYAKTGKFQYYPGFCRRRHAARRSPTSTGERAGGPTALPDRAVAISATTSRPATCLRGTPHVH
jgi:hypothetical protein